METVRVGCPTERVFRPEINQIHNRNNTSKAPTGDREWGVSDRASRSEINQVHNRNSISKARIGDREGEGVRPSEFSCP